MALRISSSIRKVDRVLKNGLLTGNFNTFAKAQPKSLETRRFLCLSSLCLSNKPKGFMGLKGNNKGATNVRSAGHGGMSTDQKVSGEKAGEGVVTSRTPGPPDLVAQPPFHLRLAMLLRMPPAPKDVQLKYAWNSEDRSSNISVKEDDKLTCRRHPAPQNTLERSTRSKEGHNGISTPQQHSNQDPGSASDGWSIGDIFGD